MEELQTSDEILAACEAEFGFRPAAHRSRPWKVNRDLEQTIVSNELRDLRYRMANAQGEQLRLLRLKLERKIKVAHLLGFKTEP